MRKDTTIISDLRTFFAKKMLLTMQFIAMYYTKQVCKARLQSEIVSVVSKKVYFNWRNK